MLRAKLESTQRENERIRGEEHNATMNNILEAISDLKLSPEATNLYVGIAAAHMSLLQVYIRAELSAVQEKSSAEITSLKVELAELKMQHLVSCQDAAWSFRTTATMKKEQGTEPELERALSELREQLDTERSEKRELQETVKKLQTLVNVHTELEAVKSERDQLRTQLQDVTVIPAEVQKSFEVDVQEVEVRIHGRELHMKHLESEGVQLIKKSSTSEPSSLMSLLKSGAPPFDIFKKMFLPYGTSLKFSQHFTKGMHLLQSIDFVWCQAPYTGYLFQPK